MSSAWTAIFSRSIFFGAYPGLSTERRIIHRVRGEHRVHREEEALTGGAVFFRVEKFGEARIFLEEGKILVVAGVVAILGAQLNGDFKIGHGRIGFAGEAIERGEGVVNMVGFGRRFAGLDEAFAGVVPTADVHHGHAALVMFLCGARIQFGRGPHALLGDLDVHAGAVGELFAGAFQNFFEFLLGASKFLLMEERQSFIVDFELRLNERIDELDTAALVGVRGH